MANGNGGQGPNAYERGQKDAGVDAELDAHNTRLDLIVRAVEKSAAGLLSLEAVVREQGEDARLAAATLIAAAEALAKETETRRIVLADSKAMGEQKFTRREKVLTAGISIVLLVLALLAVINPPG